jgi:hypothetical protein
MLKNYIKIALRNLWKSKGFSAINIIGLAIGLATCLLIMLFVLDELSYDRYNKKANRIYRVDGDIKLEAAKSYSLSLALANGLVKPSDPQYDVTEEIEKEGDEHIFFFSWTSDIFGDPLGNGNIDSRTDVVNYEDQDVNGLPMGLATFWTAGVASSGDFRIMLKHQPDLKSATSESGLGETDLDLTFTVKVE